MSMKKYRSLIKNILQFTVIYKLIILFCFSPVLRLVLKEYLKRVSVSIAFNQNMIKVFLSFQGILIFLILMIIMIFLIYYNLYVVIQIITLEYQQKSYQLKEIVLKSFQDLKNVHKPTFLLSGLYMLLLLPLVHVGYINNYVTRWDIPAFIFSELQLTNLGQLLIVLIYILYYGLYLLCIFVPLYLFLQRISFFQAIKKGYQLLKKISIQQKLSIFVLFLIWIIAENGIMKMLHYPLLHNQDFNIYFFKYFLHLTSFRYSVLQYIYLYLLSIIAMTFFLRYLVSLFCQYETKIITIQDQKMDTSQLQHMLKSLKNAVKKSWMSLKDSLLKIKWIQTYQKYIRIVCIVCLGVVGLIYFHQDLRLHQPYVIGHRGSRYAIENTFEAVENAAYYGSDFAEIDIQLSQDDIPVVYHDYTMSRLSNSSSAVSQLTASQFEEVTLQSQQMSAHPVTLEHMIQKIQQEKLDIQLLIELKPTDNNYQKMVEQVVNIIKQYDFSSQCIFMSLDYPAVAYVHYLCPDWIAGYCIYGSIGDIDASIWTMDIDFLAIEENRASTSFIQKAMSQMLPVYVWTVDDEKKMQQYLDMGVSGIITNYPDIAREVVDDYLLEHPYSYIDGDI